MAEDAEVVSGMSSIIKSAKNLSLLIDITEDAMADVGGDSVDDEIV